LEVKLPLGAPDQVSTKLEPSVETQTPCEIEFNRADELGEVMTFEVLLDFVNNGTGTSITTWYEWVPRRVSVYEHFHECPDCGDT